MLSTAHTLTSLPFAFIFDNPVAILGSTIIWHFISDMVLHWNIDPKDYPSFPYIRVGLDVVIGPLITLCAIRAQTFSTPVILAVFGGNLPDIIHGFWYIANEKYRRRMSGLLPFFRFHEAIQWETKRVIPGLIPQGLAIIASLVFILLA